jgi:hypothetical protein
LYDPSVTLTVKIRSAEAAAHAPVSKNPRQQHRPVSNTMLAAIFGHH